VLSNRQAQYRWFRHNSNINRQLSSGGKSSRRFMVSFEFDRNGVSSEKESGFFRFCGQSVRYQPIVVILVVAGFLVFVLR
jgi:hypothetical protein